jgi:hypothetical protein
LSHPPTFSIFQIGTHIFAWAGLGPRASYFHLPCRWDYRHILPCLACF